MRTSRSAAGAIGFLLPLALLVPVRSPGRSGETLLYRDANQPVERRVEEPATPLYPLGHGSSYTTFEYENLQNSPKAAGAQGEEVVQLYLRDVIASVSRP